jgi:hypothetical protein
MARLVADKQTEAVELLRDSRITIRLAYVDSWPDGDYYRYVVCLWVAGNGHRVLDDDRNPTGEAIWSATSMTIESILPTAYVGDRQVWSEEQLRFLAKWWNYDNG